MGRIPLTSGQKRALRQRCGFGCVVCGSPIFDYEHILGYGITGNDISQMTLLCSSHHREKTAGRLPVQAVRQANADPVNRRRNLGAEHALYFDGEEFCFELAGVRMESAGKARAVMAIVVDGEVIVGADFEDGRVLLDIVVRDARDNLMLLVRRGELRHTTGAWDIVFQGRTLTIRQGLGDILLSITFDPPGRIVIERGVLWARGVLMRIGPDASLREGFEVVNTNNGFAGMTFKNFPSIFNIHNGSNSAEPARSQLQRTWGRNGPIACFSIDVRNRWSEQIQPDPDSPILTS